jgi:hypothetical protein
VGRTPSYLSICMILSSTGEFIRHLLDNDKLRRTGRTLSGLRRPAGALAGERCSLPACGWRVSGWGCWRPRAAVTNRYSRPGMSLARRGR